MSINEAFFHDCIILDACCIINLYASGQMRAVLETIPKNLSVAAYVKDHEALNVYSGPVNNVKSTLIDLQPFIDDNLLLLVDIETEAEENIYINFAERLDDGEAITGAIALSRNWAIATDDTASVRLFQSRVPHIAIVSTLDLVKYWSDTSNIDEDTIREALSNIRVRGKYEPNRNHPLKDWWNKLR